MYSVTAMPKALRDLYKLVSRINVRGLTYYAVRYARLIGANRVQACPTQQNLWANWAGLILHGAGTARRDLLRNSPVTAAQITNLFAMPQVCAHLIKTNNGADVKEVMFVTAVMAPGLAMPRLTPVYRYLWSNGQWRADDSPHH